MTKTVAFKSGGRQSRCNLSFTVTAKFKTVLEEYCSDHWITVSSFIRYAVAKTIRSDVPVDKYTYSSHDTAEARIDIKINEKLREDIYQYCDEWGSDIQSLLYWSLAWDLGEY